MVLDDSLQPIQLPQGGVSYQITTDGTITGFDPAAPANGFEVLAVLGIRDATGIDPGSSGRRTLQADEQHARPSDF